MGSQVAPSDELSSSQSLPHHSSSAAAAQTWTRNPVGPAAADVPYQRSSLAGAPIAVVSAVCQTLPSPEWAIDNGNERVVNSTAPRAPCASWAFVIGNSSGSNR